MMMERRISVDLNGQVAVVTGGGGVLGSQMARALANSGAAVAILNRRQETAKGVADAIAASG